MRYIELRSGFSSPNGTDVAAIVDHVELPSGWDEMSEDEQERWAESALDKFEQARTWSEWELVGTAKPAPKREEQHA
jgi:hypothetical protein